MAAPSFSFACANCKKPFTAVRKNARTCSDACRKALQRKSQQALSARAEAIKKVGVLLV